jgi:hypothetical protein
VRLTSRIAFVAILVPLAAGCRLFSSDLGKIASQPFRFHGQEVTVEGRVEAVRWMPQVGAMGFCLVNGADSLLVLTQSTTPAEGEEVRIAGRVHRNFPVGEDERVVLLAIAQPKPGNGDVR